jgi:hypothetical protein
MEKKGNLHFLAYTIYHTAEMAIKPTNTTEA